MYNRYFIPLHLLLFTGCTQYATVQTIHPSESYKTTHIKTLAVDTIQQDTIALSQNLQASLSGLHPYFSVVSIQSKPQGVIRGAVTSSSIDITPYNIEQNQCIDRECKRRQRIILTCIKKSSSVNANLQVFNPLNREILFAKDEYAYMEQNHCPDDRNPITSDSDHFAHLSSEIAQRFASRLVPNSTSYNIELMDKADIVYTKEQSVLFETSLESISSGRSDKALEYLKQLNGGLQFKSYVALYNIGVAQESLGQLEEAFQSYKKADQLIPTSNNLIDTALVRIEKVMRDRNEALLQLNK